MGTPSYFSLRQKDDPLDKVYTFNDIPDLNNDGSHNWDDLASITEEEEGKSNENCWKSALSAGSKAEEGQVVAPFNSVLDRNVGTAVTEINITNSSKPGTIEILKYTGAVNDNRHLSGATFRIYKGEKNKVQETLDKYNAALDALNNADSENKDDLKKKLDEALEEVNKIQIGSATTRVNGRVAFAGLDPNETYTIRERFAPSGYRIIEEYYQVDPKGTTESKEETMESPETVNCFDSNNYCLLTIGNAKATDELNIQKTIKGRSWTEEDKFTFNIEVSDFQIENEDKAGYVDYEKEVEKFKKYFENSDDVTIEYENEYAKINDEDKSLDTKISESLLQSGKKDEKKAGLLGYEFPVPGTYTFTIQENAEENEAMKYSKRIFTVSVLVSKVLDSDQIEEENPDLEKTHLEASVSKITYKENEDPTEGEESNNVSITYAGNTPTFINEYIVEDIKQDVSYVVQKNLFGRENNVWRDDDEFKFTITGANEETEEALKEEKIVVEGTDLNVKDNDFEFTISNEQENHQYLFSKIDFNENHFELGKDEEGNPITEPIEYMLNIKEQIPEEAKDNIYKGIAYSKDVYTLKITLENSANTNLNTVSNLKKVIAPMLLEEGSTDETDGKIDYITFELYKNYDFSLGANNIPISKCTVDKTNDSGTVHADAEGHLMVFENRYETSIKVTKKWEDTDNQYGKRPDSVKVVLNGYLDSELVSTKEATITGKDEENEWTYVFNNIKECDDNGKLISYELSEESANGDLLFYQSEIGEIKKSENPEYGYEATITNTFKVPEEKIEIPVEKIWQFDNSKQAEKIPEEITLEVSADGYMVEIEDKLKTIKLSGKREVQAEAKTIIWEGSFKDLPKYDQKGDEIKYEVKEIADTLFYKQIQQEVDHDGKVIITNQFNKPDTKIDIEVVKEWKDNDTQKLRRPNSIIINVKNGKEQVWTHEFTKVDENTQTYSFTGLDKYDDNGDEIIYTVEEAEKNGGDLKFYNTKVEEMTIVEENKKQIKVINSFKLPEEIKKLEPVTVTVKKEWTDNDIQKAKRPQSIKFVLEDSEGTKQEETISVKDESTQTYKFENLPKYNENGEEITYKVTEKEVANGDLRFYDSSIGEMTEGDNKEVTITNTFKSKEDVENLEKITVNVKKVWEDTEIQKKRRPEKIQIKLKGDNGTEQENSITDLAGDTQTLTFKDLPKYNEDGQEIKYSVEEVGANSDKEDLKFYNTTINGLADTGEDNVKQATITNAFKSSEQIKKLEPIQITVKKVWEDNDTQKSRRPKQLKFVVEGSDGTQYNETITIEGENQTVEFDDLPRYDENGQEIEYQTREEEVQEGDLKFYNATKDTKDVDNNKEVTIKNSFKTEQEMKELESFKIIVNKNWVDTKTQEEQRPEKIKIKLNAINGTDQVQEINKSTDDKQTVTFDNLPKYNSNGQEIVYSVEEEGANQKDGDLKFYTTTTGEITDADESGTKQVTITNTFKDIEEIEKLEQVNVKVTKNWVENNDKQKARRPQEITIKVLAENGRKTEETKIEKSEGNTQTYTFENLPKYNGDGQEVQYNVEEVNSNLNTGDLRFYKTTTEPKNKDDLEEGINNEFIITNTFKTLEEIEQLEKVNVTITKNWDDEGEQKAKRPEQLKFKLMGSNNKTTEQIVDVDAEDSKTYIFENLPKFDANGEEVVYRAEESEVNAGDLKFYSTTVQNIENDTENENNKNITITNKFLIPEESLQIKINVVWDDRDNTFNKRPKELILQVKEKATGEVVAAKQTNVFEQNSSYTFNNIRKYDEVGNQIEYAIDESEVTENDLFYYTKTIGELVQSKESKTNKVANESEGQLIENIYEGTITNKLTKIPGFIDIEYKDKNTQEELKTKVTKEGIVGEKLDITPYKEEIDDYVLVQEPEEKSVEFTEKNQTVTYYYAKKTKVTVKYLEKDTNKTLEEDYIINGYEGAKYTTEAQELQNYDLVESTNNTEGTMPREPIEVIYYYQLVEPNLVNPKITKESTLENATENNQRIPYTIKYSVDIDKYIGDATITIVDSLPTAINKDLSSLDGGTYNAENKTITWEEEIKDINTYEDVNDKVSIEKNIEVTYEGLNVEEGNITNSASATITLKTPEKVDIQTTTKVIPTEFTKSITAKKVWNDDNNKAGKRPKQITLVLTGKTANYTKEHSYTINENGSNVWDHTFEDLPKYDSTGKEIQYTIREEDVGSIFYTQESIDQATMTITNKFVVPKEEIEVTVVKEWNDNDNEYNKRPQTLVLQLNSVTKDTTTNTEIENLLEEHTINLQTENSYTFTNLPKYDANGDEILYRATEREENEGDLFHYLGSAGAMQEEETDKYRITLTNVLAKIPGKVKVKYVDKYTEEEISEAVEKEGIVGEEFNVEEDKKNIKGYTLIEEPKSKKGNYTKEDQEKIYYYAKNTSVIVKYLEKDTKKVLTPEESYSIQGYEGKEYTTEQKEIEGYTFVESTENTTGVMARNKIEVIYWYAQNTKATVQHIDKITEEILKETTVEGKVGDLFITHPEDFEGYTLVEEPEERTVPMEKEEVVLKYYYIHASQGVLGKHIDAITGEVLSEELHEGKDGDTYEVKPKEFKGYDLMQEDEEGNSKLPDNNKGKMNKELIEVRYYYLKKATLKVQYIDKETGKALAEDVIVNGHEGDSYTTEQKEFENYKLVDNTDNLKGTLTVTLNEKGEYDNETLVQYFYERLEAKVTERHFDITTGELLSEQIHMGKVGDAYDIPSKEFDEYDVAEADSNGNNKLPKNSKGKMTKEDIVVNYYYIRKAEIEIQYVEKESNIPLEIPEIVSGHVGDNYTTEQKQFNYYVFVESTENTQGTMQKDKTTIIYYYRKQTFNLKIDKWISSIIVDGAERAGNTLETMNNMLKIDIPKNKIETTNVKIKYTIRVTNTGEIEGTIRELTENIPNGFTMYQEDNELIWVREENTYRTTDLKDTAIKPGEYYEVSLVLRWTNSADNFGEKTSKTTISKVNNVAEFEEILNEDNVSEATILLLVTTGMDMEQQIKIIMMEFAILGELMILIRVCVLCKRKINKK